MEVFNTVHNVDHTSRAIPVYVVVSLVVGLLSVGSEPAVYISFTRLRRV